MPPAVRFRSRELEQLWEETRFAPARTRLRMMQDAEQFAAEVDPAAGYPPTLVVERVTRYRPEQDEVGHAVVGAAIIADLAAFVLRTSKEVPLESDARGGALSLADAARSLGVAQRSLLRYRQEGLFLHHARFMDGRVRVACFRDAIERFRARSSGRLERAARTARVTPQDRAELEARALGLIAQGCASLHALATALAPTLGRSVRAVRSALERSDAIGAALASAAGRANPAPATRARRELRARAAALRGILAELPTLELPIFSLPDAADAVLAPPVVRSGLPSGALALPEPRALSGQGTRGGRTGAALLVAHHFLLRRAKAAALQLGPTPALAPMDQIETDLRWAFRLKRALVEQALPSAMAVCAQHLGVAWEQIPDERRRAWACFAIREATRALQFTRLLTASVEDVRPTRAVALAVELALAHEGRGFAPRGEERADALALAIAQTVPWSALVSGHDDLREAAMAAPAEVATLLSARFGFSGAAPETYVQLARRLRTSVPTACARCYAAMASLGAAPDPAME